MDIIGTTKLPAAAINRLVTRTALYQHNSNLFQGIICSAMELSKIDPGPNPSVRDWLNLFLGLFAFFLTIRDWLKRKGVAQGGLVQHKKCQTRLIFFDIWLIFPLRMIKVKLITRLFFFRQITVRKLCFPSEAGAQLGAGSIRVFAPMDAACVVAFLFF